MGRSVACQLAAKGANVVIVARTTSKLKAALETITVGFCSFLIGIIGTNITATGFRDTPRSTEIPLHQRRLDKSLGLQTDHRRSHQVE